MTIIKSVCHKCGLHWKEDGNNLEEPKPWLGQCPRCSAIQAISQIVSDDEDNLRM